MRIDYFDIIAHWFGKSEVVQDELEWYMKVSPLAVSTQEALSFDLIVWRANKMVYPTLARIAYELYSIPSMSAEVEWVFSRFYLKKHELTRVAQSWYWETVEIIFLLNQWNR